jgi:hypothetical protein
MLQKELGIAIFSGEGVEDRLKDEELTFDCSS